MPWMLLSLTMLFVDVFHNINSFESLGYPRKNPSFHLGLIFPSFSFCGAFALNLNKRFSLNAKNLVGKFLPLNLLYGVIPSLCVVLVVNSQAACSTSHANAQCVTGTLLLIRSSRPTFNVLTIPATCLHAASVVAFDDESYAAGRDSWVFSIF